MGILVLVVICTIAAPAGAVTVVVGFEVFEGGTELSTQYEASGVRFVAQDGESAGAIVVPCDGSICDAAQEGQNAAITPQHDGGLRTAFGIAREPLVAEFVEPQSAVSLSVQDVGDLEGLQVARLIARNGAGEVVAREGIQFEVDSGWHRIGVATDSAEIATVTLTLSVSGDARGPHNFMVVDALQFQHNEPPEAGFDVRPETPVVGEEVALDAGASSDVDGEITEYRWDLNADGDVDQVTRRETLIAVFRRSGPYTVTLTVVDDDGASARVTRSITVTGPTARCSVDDTNVETGEVVLLDASASRADLVRFDVDGDGDYDRTDRGEFRESVVYDEARTVRPVVRAEIGDEFEIVQCSAITVSPPGGPSGADIIAGGTGGVFGLFVLRKVYSEVIEDDGENQPPSAAIGLLPEDPAPGQPVFIDGSGSSDPDPDDHVASYRWSIGDRHVAGPRTVHIFLEEGDHEIELEVADTRGATDTTERTVTVASTAGNLTLEEAHPDAPGDDHENLVEEYLVFRNVGEEAIDLGGWTVHDTAEAERRVTPGKHTFEFPEGFALDPDERVTVHTGTEPEGAGSSLEMDGGHHLFWEAGRAIWNNDEDVIVVENADGQPVMAVRYRRAEPKGYEFEDLDVTVLEGWFGRVVVSSREGSPAVRLAPASGLGAKFVSGTVGILVGATLLKGPMRFTKSWANLTGFFVSSAISWTATTVTGLLPPSVEPIIPLLLIVGSVGLTLVGGIGVAVTFVVSSLWDLLSSG